MVHHPDDSDKMMRRTIWLKTLTAVIEGHSCGTAMAKDSSTSAVMNKAAQANQLSCTAKTNQKPTFKIFKKYIFFMQNTNLCIHHQMVLT